ncbi:MAG TPA: I78 family peptidase inhibitor [Arenimonas sp.]|jgi:hypothetical protein|nr:I78 family peptidase inhibitor [Arenimonas sp.]
MSKIPRLTVPMLLLALAACAKGGSPTQAELGPFANEPEPPPALNDPGLAEQEPDMSCKAESLSWTVGQVADEALTEKARVESGARTVRVIKPGMAVTMDYREDRLNLELDDEGRVVRAYCS